MAERSGYRPTPIEQHRGFTQSRRPERTSPRPNRYDQPAHYRSYVEQMDDPNRRTFTDWWKDLAPGAKAIYGTAAVGLVLGGGFGAMKAMEAFDRARFGEPQKPVKIDLSDPSIPGHDSVVPETSEPSVTYTSAPPGKEPITIRVPKK